MLVDLEQSLLSKITDTESLRLCWDRGLRETVFEDPRNAQIYRFSVDYWMQNSMTTAPNKRVIETEFGTKLIDTSDESLTWLIEKLKDRYTTNRTQNLIRDVLKKVSTDPAEALTDLFNQSWEIKEQIQSRNDRVDMAENIQTRRDRYQQRQENPNQGAPLGLPEIDEHTGGILPSELGIVAGYTKTGKSFALVKAGVEARKQGWKPVIFSLEQAIPEFEDRIDAFASGVGYGRLQRAELDMDEMRRLHEAQEEMAEHGPLHVERPEPGERTVTNMINRARQIGADYVIIDQLSWMDTERYYQRRQDAYKELVNGLKNEIGRDSAGSLPCLLAVQFNRDAVTKKGGRGGMENIANAADVEQAVDIAIGLYRNREIRANNSMILDILGTRRGDLKSWLLGWYLNNETNIFVRSEYVERDTSSSTD